MTSFTTLMRMLTAASVALLAACGPGEGGTGTGSVPAALSAFGAQAASVCTGALAAALQCNRPPGTDAGAPVGAPGGTPVGPSAGTDRLVLANGPEADASLSAVLDGNQIDFVARCLDTEFAGAWGVRPGEDARYYGTLLRSGSPQPELATVTLEPDAQLRFRLVLRAADGSLVLGPVLLQRVAAPPTLSPRC